MNQPKILIVDDIRQNIIAMEKVLRPLPVTLLSATSGNDALGMVLEHDVALVLLDVQMPQMDGFETAELMRSDDDTRHIPIIFVTAINKEDRFVFKGYESGAVDYLFKPIDPYILKSKVQVFLELHRQKTKLLRLNAELKSANRQILDQQRAVIEEERLKVLLQIAGATAHELNQPLTVLLGNIELLELCDDHPPKVRQQMTRIKEAGDRISSIVTRIQAIRHTDIKPYASDTVIADINRPVSILSVDGSAEDVDRLQSFFEKKDNVAMASAQNLKEAFERLETGEFDVIFLDYLFEDGTAFDFFSGMEKRGLETPVIIITGHGDELLASQMIQIGAYEYFPKNRLDADLLREAIVKTREKAGLKKEMRNAQAKMAEMSTRDELTRLANRRYFNEVLDVKFQRAHRLGEDLCLGIMDLDHFKAVNDTYGHPAGDQVLIHLADLLKTCMRHNDLACRYGGEEFVFILTDTDPAKAATVCERLRSAIASLRVSHESDHISVTASIGIACNTDAGSPQDLLASADMALYEAKAAGRNRVVAYSRHMAE